MSLLNTLWMYLCDHHLGKYAVEWPRILMCERCSWSPAGDWAGGVVTTPAIWDPPPVPLQSQPGLDIRHNTANTLLPGTFISTSISFLYHLSKNFKWLIVLQPNYERLKINEWYLVWMIHRACNMEEWKKFSWSSIRHFNPNGEILYILCKNKISNNPSCLNNDCKWT